MIKNKSRCWATKSVEQFSIEHFGDKDIFYVHNTQLVTDDDLSMNVPCRCRYNMIIII